MEPDAVPPPVMAPVEMPSKVVQASTLAWELARWAAAGSPRTTPEQLAERQALCNACEFKVMEKDRERCGKCGCYLYPTSWLMGTVETPGKLELGTSECPIGRWKSLL